MGNSAETVTTDTGSGADPWIGTFPTTDAGRLLSAKSLGRILRGQVGRWRDQYVLRADRDPHTKINTYAVERRDATLIGGHDV